MTPERLLTTKELATYLKVTTRTLYNLARRDVLSPIRVASSARWDLNEVLAQLRQHDLGQAV